MCSCYYVQSSARSKHQFRRWERKLKCNKLIWISGFSRWKPILLSLLKKSFFVCISGCSDVVGISPYVRLLLDFFMHTVGTLAGFKSRIPWLWRFRTGFRPPSAMHRDVGNWMFLKLGIFWEIFWKSFGFFLDFWEEFFWRIVWEDFFGMDFLGGIFWEEFFVYIALVKPAKLFESERDWCFCQDFISKKKEEEEEGKKFRSLEVQLKLIALKNKLKIVNNDLADSGIHWLITL